MTHEPQEASALPTPFAQPSWEPRFALDGPTPSLPLLTTALRLHVDCSHHAWAWRDGAPVFHGFCVRPDRVAIAARLGGFPGPLRDAEPWFADATLDAAATHLAGWLTTTAAYPPTPWFDGGEGRGFQAWHVAYGQPGPYGYLVVEPKWFEIHK
ncbi:MAG: hypothetical protein IPH80_02985 [Myxococcales bacterium]|nr:hypothetical protein [Myxococcales bacterium]